MAERIRLRIRAFVIIDIIPETTSSPPSNNGGSSSSTPTVAPVGTPRMAPVGTPRYPPPGFPSPSPGQPRLPGYLSPDFARLLGVLNNEPRVDPSEPV